MFGQRRGIVLEHLGLIDLEDDGLGGPVDAVRPRVEAGREDHHLADPRVDGVGEERVEEMSAHTLVGLHELEDRSGLGIELGQPGGNAAVQDVFPDSGACTGDQDLRSPSHACRS